MPNMSLNVSNRLVGDVHLLRKTNPVSYSSATTGDFVA